MGFDGLKRLPYWNHVGIVGLEVDGVWVIWNERRIKKRVLRKPVDDGGSSIYDM